MGDRRLEHTFSVLTREYWKGLGHADHQLVEELRRAGRSALRRTAGRITGLQPPKCGEIGFQPALDIAEDDGAGFAIENAERLAIGKREISEALDGIRRVQAKAGEQPPANPSTLRDDRI